jgi:hypothetical protein
MQGFLPRPQWATDEFMTRELQAIKHQETVREMMHVVSGRWVGAQRASSMSPLLAELYGRVYDLDVDLTRGVSGSELNGAHTKAHVATIEAVRVVVDKGRAAARLHSEIQEIEALDSRIVDLRDFFTAQSPTPLAKAS